jgi:hypothetical protein
MSNGALHAREREDLSLHVERCTAHNLTKLARVAAA